MRSMRADSTMSGLADDDDQSRGHPADTSTRPEAAGQDSLGAQPATARNFKTNIVYA